MNVWPRRGSRKRVDYVGRWPSLRIPTPEIDQRSTSRRSLTSDACKQCAEVLLRKPFDSLWSVRPQRSSGKAVRKACLSNRLTRAIRTSLDRLRVFSWQVTIGQVGEGATALVDRARSEARQSTVEG